MRSHKVLRDGAGMAVRQSRSGIRQQSGLTELLAEEEN
jgi:hypothetical protein